MKAFRLAAESRGGRRTREEERREEKRGERTRLWEGGPNCSPSDGQIKKVIRRHIFLVHGASFDCSIVDQELSEGEIRS